MTLTPTTPSGSDGLAKKWITDIDEELWKQYIGMSDEELNQQPPSLTRAVAKIDKVILAKVNEFLQKKEGEE